MDMYNTGHLYDHLQVLEREEVPLGRRERLNAVERPLLAWCSSGTRSLPWRDNPKSYRVWILEIILRQTRIEAVKPYFERFMGAFPIVSHLAQAESDHLMKIWEGLGYYNRAGNLKATAQTIMSEYGGYLPASSDELVWLPGIGSYTAGAIASVAYGIPLPAVDGGVFHAISRLLGDRKDIKGAPVKIGIETELKVVMPRDKASHYNQGLIEIGTLVYMPDGEPRCSQCPLASICLTRKNGWWKEVPYKSPARTRKVEEQTVFIIEYQNKVVICERPPKGLLTSLYELLNIKGKISGETVPRVLGLDREQMASVELLPEAKRMLSHVEWHMTGYRAILSREGEPLSCFMVSREELEHTYALPNAFNAYTKLIG